MNVYLQYNNLKNFCNSYLNPIFWFSRPPSKESSFLLLSNFIICFHTFSRGEFTGFNTDLIENKIIYVGLWTKTGIHIRRCSYADLFNLPDP